jgi:acetyl esterase
MSNTYTEDIEYRIVGGETLLARLYRPANGAAAALIDVHGGAWVQGDRLSNAVMHQYLAERGIAVLALDFRMAPAHRYPASMTDIRFGIRWAKSHRERLGIDAAGLIGGLGTSSGGHQIVLAALRPDEAADYPDADPAGFAVDDQLDFVIACWPILDPLARYHMAKAKNIKVLIDAHDAFWPDELAMSEGNPQLIVERGEASRLPPILIIQGTADENVDHEGADRFAGRYANAGGTCRLLKFADEPHAFITKNPDAPASMEALEQVARFINAAAARTRA